MKIIDKTQFQNAQGEIDILGRIQGTLKFGPSWYAELQAQKVVIAQLDRVLEKGFVLIRNFNLPGSEVIIPLILLGPNGVSVIYVTHLKGFYEAKGDQWNKVDQGRSLPASRNLLSLVERLARATQKFFEVHNLNVPGSVEPVLIAADPGLNVETMRPFVKVIKSDAIKAFASSLLQNRPVLRNEQVYALAERIVSPAEEVLPPPAPSAVPAQPEPSSRAKAIFNASDSAPAFDSSDLAFAFDDKDNPLASKMAPGLTGSSSVRELSQAPVAARKKPILGMKPGQLMFLIIMSVVECCILVGGAAYLYLYK
jgi:hypothetical protein